MQIINRPWLIEESHAEQWLQVANQVLFHNQAFPVNPNAHKPYSGGAEKPYAFRVDSNAMRNPQGNVLVVEIRGPLMKNDYCGSPGMETFAQVIEAAQMDETIESIIARIDSPGGTVDGTHNLARTIRRSPKATVAYAYGAMYSAAYWIGSSFNEIIADDANAGYNTGVGSIGTKATIIDTRDRDKQQGYKVRHVYASKSKRKGRVYEDMMEGNDERLVAELDALNETFLADVKANRPNLALDIENVLEGDIYNAREGLKYGLVDKISNFRYAVKRSLQLAKTIRK